MVGAPAPPEAAPAGGPVPEGAAPAPEGAVPGATSPEVPAEPTPAQQAALSTGPMKFKSFEDKSEPDEWEIKSEQTVDRWTEILDRSLERLFERQQRVVLEKASGAKARKAIASGDLKFDMIFDIDTWNKQAAEDLRPVFAAIANEAAEMSMNDGKTGEDLKQEPINQEDLQKYLDEQTQRVQKVNETTRDEIIAAILVLMLLGNNEDKNGILRTALGAIFAELLGRRRRYIAEQEANTAYNAGVYLSATNAMRQQSGAEGGNEPSSVQMMKTWITSRDSKVRHEHQLLQGKTIPYNKGFKVDGHVLRFPGDPLAPPHLTINCRCKLRWS
jgi:hypothetical protein